MAGLVDQFGRPVSTALLRKEQAAAEVTGVRQVIGNLQSNVEPQRLARLLRAAGEGEPLEYLELAETMEERDLHYLGVLSTRKRAVAQLEITVEAASDEAADVENAALVEEWVARESLEDELFDVLDAIGKGFSVSEILWETSERQWWPKRVVWRDPRWFEFDRVDGETLLLRQQGQSEPLAPWKFVVHTHKAKSGLTIRSGLARIAAWGYMFKSFALRDWVTFASVYGMPIRVGRYGPDASPADISTLRRAVASISSDAAAVMPQSMEIAFQQAASGTAGGEVFEKLVRFVDEQISKGVLGQTTTTDAISGGHAVSKEHQEVRLDILRSDGRQLAATLNRDLVQPFVALNRGPQQRYPRLVIALREAEDTTALVDNVVKLVPLGLRVEQSVLRDKLGLPEPDKSVEPDDLLRAPAPPPDPFAGRQAAAEEEQEAPPAKGAVAANAQRAAQASERSAEGDELDALVARMLDGWEPAEGELTQPFLDAIQEATSYEDLQARLVQLLAEEPSGAFVERLARGLFAARAGGEVGVRSDGELER